MGSRHSMDLTSGPVFRKLLVFALPLLASSLLQHLYNAADIIVVGNFAQNGETALAAVSSTGSLTVLLLNIFNGLSIGTNIVCANLYGARRKDALSRCMHTALLVALVGGLFISAVGLIFARDLLKMMACPEDVIDQATLYMRVYFCGIPGSLLYNFGAGILRAHGDTKRPMFILGITGLVNVALNLVFVIGLHWDVAGVAAATIISQYLSAIVVLLLLFSPKGEFRLTLRNLRFDREQLIKILRVGIPCGLNGMVFSIANVLLQSTINGFNSATIMAGSGAASNIADFVYLVIASFYSACVSFSGQCYGAKKYKRIDKLFLWAVASCMGGVAICAIFITIFRRQLLGIYNSDSAVIDAGVVKLMLMAWGYIIYAIPEVTIGCLRGIGKSAGPTVLNMFCICLPRLLWIWIFFPLLGGTPEVLYLCFPISWTICAIGQLIYFLYSRKQLHRQEALTAKE